MRQSDKWKKKTTFVYEKQCFFAFVSSKYFLKKILTKWYYSTSWWLAYSWNKSLLEDIQIIKLTTYFFLPVVFYKTIYTSNYRIGWKRSTTTYFQKGQYVNINSFVLQILPYFPLSCSLFVRMCDFLCIFVLNGKRIGLNGKGIRLHSHAPSGFILKTRVWHVERLKHCMMRSPFVYDSLMFYTCNYTF